jgi:hypothetical protein
MAGTCVDMFRAMEATENASIAGDGEICLIAALYCCPMHGLRSLLFAMNVILSMGRSPDNVNPLHTQRTRDLTGAWGIAN